MPSLGNSDNESQRAGASIVAILPGRGIRVFAAPLCGSPYPGPEPGHLFPAP